MHEDLKRLDPRPIPDSEPGVRAFICLRNERVRLPCLLEHHRRLGVRRFFFIDNDSSDGTVDFLLSEPDVHLWYTKASFRDSAFGTHWLISLLNNYAVDRWALILDADELLVYPEFEHAGLAVVCDYLDRQELRVLPTMLLDMYSDRPIIATTYEFGQNMLSVCPYFDRGDYRLNPDSGFIYGGVRHRLFRGEETRSSAPIMLAKYALRRWLPGPDLDLGIHRSSLPGARNSPLAGALLHFKFIDSFVRRAQEESVRKEHWNGASEYADYVRKFAAHPDLCLMGPASVRYENSEQLVRLGLMRTTPGYHDLANRNDGGGPGVVRFSAGGLDDSA